MKKLLKVLVVGLVVLTSCNKEEVEPKNKDVVLGTFESTGGCIPNRTWEITITKYNNERIYEFRCKTATGFETRRYAVVSDEDDIFTIDLTTSSTIYMYSEKPAFRCSTYLTKVN